jgi:hypothetical protein
MLLGMFIVVKLPYTNAIVPIPVTAYVLPPMVTVEGIVRVCALPPYEVTTAELPEVV